MSIKRKSQLWKYLFSDFITAAISYTLFFISRKIFIEPLKFGYRIPVELSPNFFYGLVLLPFFWLLVYYFSDYYRDVLHKSRLQELGQTFLSSLIGVTIIFFLIILDDTISNYKNYYQSYFTLFTVHFLITWIGRFSITTCTVKKIRRKEICFNTLIIGGNKPAVEVYNDMINQPVSTGTYFVGYVTVNGKNGNYLSQYLPQLGHFVDIPQVIHDQKIEEVIIAIDPSEQEMISRIITLLCLTNVRIRAIPSLNDLLSGKVPFTTLFDTPLLEISHDIMPAWQMNIKQFSDIVISALLLIILSPICLVIAILIRLTSPGPVIYSHERIGRYGKPFNIYKFRSMVVEAEKNGPELSNSHDPRVTPVGRFLRKTRLDEIPNFVNVLKGDMSLVGPRPERQYFIDQIVALAPHYVHLHRVKPGITSWGQVKYGYAENVDQMIRRLRYDLLYIENMSLGLDVKILLYTILTLLRQEGV